MTYFGDIAEDATIDIVWSSHDLLGGAITRATDGTISVYKGNSTTQTTTGVTDTEDFDSVTGIHHLRVATTDSFYETGSDYNIVLSGATIDGQSVNALLGSFSIENRTSFPKADFPANFTTLGIESDGDLTKVDLVAVTTENTDMVGTDGAYTGTPPTAAAIVDEWETQSQADPTGFHMNLLEIAGDATAVTNLAAGWDGTTGVSGDTFPATQSQVNNIGAASGGSVNIEATEDNTGGAIIDGVTFVGSVTSGTFASTESEDGTPHSMNDTGNVIDIVYGFDVGGSRAATAVQIVANLNGNTDEILIKAYDHVGAGWDTIGTLSGSGGGSYTSLDLALLTKHTGTGGELGKTYIRFDTDSTSPNSLDVDMILTSAVSTSTSVGYANGAYWVDSTGTSGTEIGTNGTADNPCTWANAVTMNATQPLNRFYIAANTSITLSAACDDCSFYGQSYFVDLGGQSIDGTFFFGANVTGTGTSSGTHPVFEDCPIGDVSLPPSIMRRCWWEGTITNTATGDWFVNHSVNRNNDASVFDFGSAVGDTSLNLTLWSGKIQLENMGDTGTDMVRAEGFGEIVEGTCTGGTVRVSGAFTTSGITNLTLSDNARIDRGQVADAVWDEVVTKAAHDTSNSAAKYLRLIKQTVSVTESAVDDAGATSTVFKTDLVAVDNFWDDNVLVFTSGALEGQSRPIATFANTNGQITLDEALTSAPSDNDEFVILSTHVHPISQIQSGLATATAQTTAQNDLDTLTGADGATLATSQPNYAPNTTTPPTAAAIVNEWETQSQADPTGFHVNVLEVNGTAQTANDNGADINTLITNQGNWATATGFSTHNAADIWTASTRTLSNFGTLVADIWASVTRTVTGGTIDTNADMRGTDSAATATELATHDGKLDTVDGKVDDVQGATFATGTDSLEAIRNRGDAAWTTGGGGAAPTEADIYAHFISGSNEDAFKADVSGLATATAQTTAQNDLDTLTGADGATLATSQPNYAPNVVVPMTAALSQTEHDATQTLINNLNNITVGDITGAVLAEPTNATAAAAWNATTLMEAIALILARDKNIEYTTANEVVLRNAADDATIATKVITYDGTTLTKGAAT